MADNFMHKWNSYTTSMCILWLPWLHEYISQYLKKTQYKQQTVVKFLESKTILLNNGVRITYLVC